MQVDNDIKTVLFAPVHTAFDISHSAFDKLAVVCLYHVVVNRHTDVVKPHGGYLFDILFGDECRIVLIIIILAALGYPAAEVDAFIKAVKVSHSFPPS